MKKPRSAPESDTLRRSRLRAADVVALDGLGDRTIDKGVDALTLRRCVSFQLLAASLWKCDIYTIIVRFNVLVYGVLLRLTDFVFLAHAIAFVYLHQYII